MSTVLRVKRRFDEEPIEALLISCKKRKLDTASSVEEPITKVLKFIATVKDQNDSIVKHISPSRNIGLKSLLEHKPDITKKIKKDIENKSKENRLKVVNCFRALDNETDDDKKEIVEENKSKITVVDIEKQPKNQENSDKPPENNESTFVYDLYYSDIPSRETCSPDFSDVLLDNLLSVHEVNMDELVNESIVDEDDPFLGDLDIEEDSNEESNWRNDYPDSDNSISEDDMRLAVNFKSLSIERDGDNACGYSSSEEEVSLAWGNDASIKDIQQYAYEESNSEDGDHFYYNGD